MKRKRITILVLYNQQQSLIVYKRIILGQALSIIAITDLQSNAYVGEDTKKELCKENGGEWEDGVCDFKTDDEDKADQFSEDVEKIKRI